MKKTILLLMGLMMLTFGVAQAAPWPITYELTGLLSGDYNGIPFTDDSFTLQINADTANVTAVSMFDTNDMYGVGNYTPIFNGPDLVGSLTISSIGTLSFVERLWVWATQGNALNPGILGVGTDTEADFLNVQDIFFETYHLITAVPLMSVSVLPTNTATYSMVTNPGGTPGLLTLTGASSVTFEAVGGVPEPSSFILLGAGLAGLVLMRRNRCKT